MHTLQLDASHYLGAGYLWVLLVTCFCGYFRLFVVDCGTCLWLFGFGLFALSVCGSLWMFWVVCCICLWLLRVVWDTCSVVVCSCFG